MKKFFTTRTVMLTLILLFATFFRLWNLSRVPPSISMDEASIGWNAYSVIKTGGDEYGKLPILSQRAYDDWRRSTYLFLTIPFIYILGLTQVAVRLPSVIMSILTVLSTYFIVLYLFEKRTVFSQASAFSATFLLAISPWYIYISRLGHESNACLSFLVFGVLFFLLGIRKKRWTFVFISMILFTISMVSYYSGQAFIPLFILGLIIIFWNDLYVMFLQNRKVIIPFLLLAVFVARIFLAIFSPDSLIRFQGTSTFKPEAHMEMYKQDVILRNAAVASHDILRAIFYNQHLFPFKVFIMGYLDHFNINWLFYNSGSESFKAPKTGLLYIWELPIIFLGFILLFRVKEINKKTKIFIFLWFFLAPVPAAIATQTPHAMRAYNFIPTWQIFSSICLGYFYCKFQEIKLLFILIFSIIVLISVVQFFHNYFVVFPKEQSNSFFYAMSRAIPYVDSVQKRYNKIIFSNSGSLYQSYMLFLYHSYYDPSLYQKQGGTKSGGYAETHAFGKYEFRPISYAKENVNTLLIGNMSDFPKDKKPLAKFANLDNKNVIEVVQK